jgi:hypothetical protein
VAAEDAERVGVSMVRGVSPPVRDACVDDIRFEGEDRRVRGARWRQATPKRFVVSAEA